MKFSRLLIVDPSLLNYLGHDYEYARSIAETARKRGIDTTVACHRNAEPTIVSSLGALPVFRTGMHDKTIDFKRFPNLSKQLRGIIYAIRFYQDWKKLMKRFHPDPTALIFIPTSPEIGFFGILFWLWMRNPATCPKVVLLFRYEARPTMKWMKALMVSLVSRNVLMPTTDSDILAGRYKELTSATYTVLPVPHIAGSWGEALQSAPSKGPFVVTYFGDSRAEKGFPMLIQAIPFLSRQIEAGEISFVLQCHRILYEAEVDAALEHLAQLEREFPEGIRSIKNTLSSEDYYGLFRDTGAVVVPYRKANYAGRTSGILVEAFAFAKPVIATAGTWLAAQVQQSQNGVLFEDGNPKSLAEAIQTVAGNLGEYRRKAATASKIWKAQHN